MRMEVATPIRKPRILLCASGSVATVKVPELALKLAEFAEVKLVVTKAGDFFLQKVSEYNPSAWGAFTARAEPIEVIRDEHEWDAWRVVGDSVLHIELKDWADVLLLAPMSANTLAKIANGLSDNLLTCIARAWNVRKSFVYAPAMNTDMWDHPVTARHLRTLGEFGYEMIPPVEKMLACGVVGKFSRKGNLSRWARRR
uniref:Flavoprotein domain-containing protein n=1 Tax=Globisporangium ultimum (strain ATCC 200006 / CBS 805.95 / DAOM BR144) TaxID=431595 RepID=K3WBB5_GLOUD